jgi:hypothetical protein
MTHETLRKALAGLDVPHPHETAPGRAMARAEIAYLNRPRIPSAEDNPFPQKRSFLRRYSTVLAGSALALTGIISISTIQIREHRSSRGNLGGEHRKDAELLAEVEKLFPGQLDAVIEHGGSFTLDISASALRRVRLASHETAKLQPLEVTLNRDGKAIRVIGYSGREVTVKLDGKEAKFEPLVDGDGNVILVGSDFIWSKAHPASVSGYAVDANPLKM